MNWTLKEIKDNIFVIIIEDSYDLAMLFCRPQEYYESPCDDFRNKDFSIWDYMKWYSKKSGGFTYANDWSGFNIPFNIIQKCYENKISETPYDEEMLKIINSISSQKKEGDAYLIGASYLNGNTLKHELCHALFTLDQEYKQKAKECLKKINENHYSCMKNNLLEMGYTKEVIDDEIQAYLMFGYDYECIFSKSIDPYQIKEYHLMFKESLINYVKE